MAYTFPSFKKVVQPWFAVTNAPAHDEMKSVDSVWDCFFTLFISSLRSSKSNFRCSATLLGLNPLLDACSICTFLFHLTMQSRYLSPACLNFTSCHQPLFSVHAKDTCRSRLSRNLATVGRSHHHHRLRKHSGLQDPLGGNSILGFLQRKHAKKRLEPRKSAHSDTPNCLQI